MFFVCFPKSTFTINLTLTKEMRSCTSLEEETLYINSLIIKETNLVSEFLDFIFSVFDPTLQSGFGSMLLFLKVLQFL